MVDATRALDISTQINKLKTHILLPSSTPHGGGGTDCTPLPLRGKININEAK